MSIKAITSRDNPRFKELRQLADSSQARRRAGRTLLDGVHLCATYLQQVGMPRSCLIGESARAHPEAAAILAQCDAGPATCLVLPDQLFGALSQVEHGVDLMFEIDTPAAGIETVYCSSGTAFAWSPKVLRAGMGAHFLLRIAENVDLAGLIKAAHVPVVATSSHATATLYALDLRTPVAWLFGHEGQGVSAELLGLASHRVGIPQPGAVESLNVAASAAVCFFEQVRQRVQR